MLNKYEEAQGLTEEMVAPIFAAMGSPEESYCLGLFRKGREQLDAVIDMLAKVANTTPQAVLRVINPRLRPMPSAAAILAHDGIWIAVDENGNLSMVFFMSGKPVQISVNGAEILTCDLTGWRFWPCDLAGNKIPWPEKDGVML